MNFKLLIKINLLIITLIFSVSNAHSATLDLAFSTNENCTIASVKTTDHEVPGITSTGYCIKTMTALTSQIPQHTSINAIDYINDNAIYFSLDTDTRLNSTLFADEDIILWNGSAFTLAWDGSTNSIPETADLDALHIISESPLEFAFSLNCDATLTIGGSTILTANEDIIHYTDGNGFTALDFDGSLYNVPTHMNLNAFCLKSPNEWLIAFDTAGSINSLSFDDSDVLLWNPTTTSFDSILWFDSSTVSVPDQVDLNALDNPPIIIQIDSTTWLIH